MCILLWGIKVSDFCSLYSVWLFGRLIYFRKILFAIFSSNFFVITRTNWSNFVCVCVSLNHDHGIRLSIITKLVVKMCGALQFTWMFHVRGRGMDFWPFCKLVDVRLTFGLVCCMIWLMRSSCCRESPSLPAAGKLGDDDFDPSPPIPLPLNCKQFEPCGELASPNITHRHTETNQHYTGFSAAIRIIR